MAQRSEIAPYDLRVFRFIPDADSRRRHVVPLTTDYIRGLTVGLTESVTHANGNKQRVDYVDPSTGELVVREDYSYSANKRSVVMSWFREDDTPAAETKTIETLYTNRDAVMRSIFSLLRKRGGGNKAQNRSARRALLNAHREDFEDYAMSGDDKILTSIANDTALGWLDDVVNGKTIRQRIINRLSAAL